MVAEGFDKRQDLVAVVGKRTGGEGGVEGVEAGQAVDAGRAVDPAVGQAGEQEDAAVLHGFHAAPQRVGLHAAVEAVVLGEDGFRLPLQNLLERHFGQAAAAFERVADAACAEHGDGFGVDGAAAAGFQPVFAASQIDGGRCGAAAFGALCGKVGGGLGEGGEAFGVRRGEDAAEQADLRGGGPAA